MSISVRASDYPQYSSCVGLRRRVACRVMTAYIINPDFQIFDTLLHYKTHSRFFHRSGGGGGIFLWFLRVTMSYDMGSRINGISCG